MEASALRAPTGLHRGTGAPVWLRLRSDEQLVGLFRSGSEEAFSAIHDRYRQRLHAYTRQMLGGSSADAEDVLQDVFLRAYRALRADERPVSLRAWLYRVAHNRCIDALRRPAPPAADIFEVSRTPVPDPSAETERREDLARLVIDVRRLPDQQRSALLMREMDGMSYADLAQALDTTVPAVKSLLVRARIGLVEAVEARDAACADIRHDLAASYDRGVRSSGRARRHLRDCAECTTYRAQLRGVRSGFAALSPSAAAPGLLAKLLGLGSLGSGGAVAAGGAASGTGVVAGAGAAAGVSKVVAIVGGAAALTGGTVDVQRIVSPTKPARAAPLTAPASAVAAGVAAAPVVAEALRSGAPAGAARRARPGPREGLTLRPPDVMAPPSRPEPRNPYGTGGSLAPADAAPAAAEPAAPEDVQGDAAVVVGLPVVGEEGAPADGAAPAGEDSGSSPSRPASGESGAGTGPTSHASDGSAPGSTTSGSGTAPSGSTSSAAG